MQENQKQYWLERFDELEMPSLTSVLSEFQKFTDGEDEGTINEMAKVVMQDASLTASLLKAANCVVYNPARVQINTVSRAIVILGLNAVKLICISVLLIENLSGGQPKERLFYCMATSFHAAVQAKKIAGRIDRRKAEEVFIAALLHNLGELCFWALDDRRCAELYQKIIAHDADEEALVREAIGTSFKSLSLGLAEQWELGDLMQSSLSGGGRSSGLSHAIVLGSELSRAAISGWETPKVQGLIGDIAKLTATSRDEVQEEVLLNAAEAIEVVASFGAPELGALIPEPSQDNLREKLQERCVRVMEPCERSYEDSLAELAHLQSHKLDFNKLSKSLLKALHEGLGLERVGVYLTLKDVKSLDKCFSASVENTDELPKSVDISDKGESLFSYAMRYREVLWMGIPASAGLRELLATVQMRELVQGRMCFCATLYTPQRIIGVLYADCNASETNLSKEQFKKFQECVRRTLVCLASRAV